MNMKTFNAAVFGFFGGLILTILLFAVAFAGNDEEPATEVYQPTVEAEATTQAVELSSNADTCIDLETAELIGRVIWGEAGGIKSKTERAAVAWCILNRADVWNKSVEEVIAAPNQFQGYRKSGECPQEHVNLAIDVLTRWTREKNGEEPVGRVLPVEYLYFIGDGSHNYFTEEYRDGLFWQWSLTSPYTN